MVFDPKSFFWIIEKRSAQWAQHLSLNYLCYDASPTALLALRGRFHSVIIWEQFFGLSQSVALSIRARGGKLIGFDTNRGSGFNDLSVIYDCLDAHETVEFSELLSCALDMHASLTHSPVRARAGKATGGLIVGLSGLQAESRRFALEEWCGMVRLWAQDSPFSIVRASPQDSEFARGMRASLGSRASLFQGSFSAMCDLLRNASRVFTVDGGFVHIASYYGVPTTAIFTGGVNRKMGSHR